MSTMTNAEMIQRSLGTVYVQRDAVGDQPPLETLCIDASPRFGVRLRDRHGRWVAPGSPRLGRNGKHDRNYLIVCEDDVSAATREALIDAGYRGVVERG